MKTHDNVKRINQYIWNLHNQVIYHINKCKINQALLTYEDLYCKALSYYKLLKEISEKRNKYQTPLTVKLSHYIAELQEEHL